MTDNELFNHFKTQSIRFNEIPDDELWAKIENSLDNNKFTFKPHIFFSIALGLILIAAITFYMLFPTAKTITSPATPVVTKQFVVSPNKPASLIKESPTSTIIEEKTITKVNPEIINIQTTSSERTITDSVKKAQIRTAKVTPASSAPTAKPASIPFRQTNGTLKKTQPSTTYEVIKKETPGNIIITTKEKITEDEYKQLILDMTNEYESLPGTLLTIKAPGHKPFKKVMGSNKKLTPDDSANLIKLNTTPTLQAESPQLNIATEKLEIIPFKTISLKNDSLQKTREKLTN